jgi:hypothetical protein
MRKATPLPTLTVQVRTRHNLLEVLANEESPAWVSAPKRQSRIAQVQVVNLDGTQMVKGEFDPESPRRANGRLILRFRKACIVNCRVDFDGQERNPVRYIES